jgi:hypothetical protein
MNGSLRLILAPCGSSRHGACLRVPRVPLVAGGCSLSGYLCLLEAEGARIVLVKYCYAMNLATVLVQAFVSCWVRPRCGMFAREQRRRNVALLPVR